MDIYIISYVYSTKTSILVLYYNFIIHIYKIRPYLVLIKLLRKSPVDVFCELAHNIKYHILTYIIYYILSEYFNVSVPWMSELDLWECCFQYLYNYFNIWNNQRLVVDTLFQGNGNLFMLIKSDIFFYKECNLEYYKSMDLFLQKKIETMACHMSEIR